MKARRALPPLKVPPVPPSVNDGLEHVREFREQKRLEEWERQKLHERKLMAIVEAARKETTRKLSTKVRSNHFFSNL